MPRRVFNMRLSEIAVEAAGISIANKTMVGGAATGLVGWLSQVNWIGVTGALVAIVGLVANIYFQRRRDRRERELHQAQLEILRKGGGQ